MVVKKWSYSYFSKASTLVCQFYLQGCRYVLVPHSIATSPPVLPTAPVTPVNRRPRAQKWPSSTSSSSQSSTPSFSGSDFTDFSSSEFDDDSSMPATPPGLGTTSTGSVVVDPFAMQGMTLTSSTSFGNISNVHMGVVSSQSASVAAVVLATSATNASSNKENMPVSMAGANIGGGNGAGANPLAVVQDGSRSRKSSLEGLVVGSMDLCQPSPASCEATYVPRAALHSLTPNGAARASQTSLNSLNSLNMIQ